LENDWNLRKRLNRPTSFTVRPSPTSNRPKAVGTKTHLGQSPSPRAPGRVRWHDRAHGTTAAPGLTPPAVSPRLPPFPHRRPHALTAPHGHRLPYPLLKREEKANTTSLLPLPSRPTFSLRAPELLSHLCSLLPPGAELPS
jgi:hypothetical protein